MKSSWVSVYVCNSTAFEDSGVTHVCNGTGLVNELHEKNLRLDDSEVKSEDAAADPISYGIACEHHHSNLVLVAQTKYKNKETGGWNTWINYDRLVPQVQN